MESVIDLTLDDGDGVFGDVSVRLARPMSRHILGLRVKPSIPRHNSSVSFVLFALVDPGADSMVGDTRVSVAIA
jgi:hypothetical protein